MSSLDESLYKLDPLECYAHRRKHRKTQGRSAQTSVHFARDMCSQLVSALYCVSLSLSISELGHAATEPEHQVQRRLLLDVVVRERPAVLELLPREDQPLLVRGNTLLILDLRLHVVDGVRSLHVEGDRLTREGLHKDLHTTPEAQHQVQRGLLLDVVVRERPAVLELLPREDQPLLVRGNTLLVLDLRLHVVDGVRS